MKLLRPLNLRRKKLKWGIAGCGKFSEQSVIPALLKLSKSEVIALYSSDINRAKSLGDKIGAEAYSDFKKFLESDIDVVYIGSANNDHYWQAIESARAKKHIVCEKPLALTAIQAKEMIEEAEKNGIHFATNFVYRFHPLIIKAKELIENQSIGKIIAINIHYLVDYPPNENFRFVKSKSGGGPLRDIGSHTIDLFRFFGGEIERIEGELDNIVYKSEVEDFAIGYAKFEKGGYGSFIVSFNAKKSSNRIQIIGYNGSIEIENLISQKVLPSKINIDLSGERKKAFFKRGDKLLSALKSFQNSFLKNEKPLSTGYDGYINMKLIEELENKWLQKKNS